MERLDIFLQKKIHGQSRTFIARLIREKRVTVDGKTVQKPHTRVSENARIEYTMPVPALPAVAPKKFPLKILFEDRDILVIDKPAGFSVHPSPTDKQDTIVSFVLAHAKKLSGAGGKLRPGIIHRLDRNTSGILVIAKNDAAHRKLAAAWEARKVHKEYIALVKGIFAENRGQILAPIGRSLADRKKMSVTSRKGSRTADTGFEVKKHFGEIASLLLIFPKTGRTHQIRVHMASIGHPVIGDNIYGDEKLNKLFEQEYGLERQFLHASSLTFPHPVTVKNKTIHSPLPRDLETVLDALTASSRA